MNIKWKYLSLIVPGTYIAVSSLHWSDIKTTRIHSGIPTSMYPPGIAGLAVLWVWFSSVQLLSRVWLFVTPWIAAHQASLSITNSQSAPRPMSIESMMPSNHLILCHSLLLLPSMSQFFLSGGHSIGVSPSASVLQDWFPLGLTGLISLLSRGFSRDFSSSTGQKHQFVGAQPSLWSNSHIVT